MPSDSLCQSIIDSLEIGVVVVDGACRRVVHRNALGGAILHALGAGATDVPSSLREDVSKWFTVEAPQQCALEVTAPNGQRYHVRAKVLEDHGGSILLFLKPRPGCSGDLRGALRKRFALSARELQVVQAVCDGLTNAGISARLGLTEGTVKNYLSRVFTVLGVQSRTQLLALTESLTRET